MASLNNLFPIPRTHEPAWDFRPTPVGFLPDKNRVVLFNLFRGGYEAYLKTIEYEKISDDLENYERCMNRERCIEIGACRHYGIPYGFFVENRNISSILRVIGGGDQLTDGAKYKVFGPDWEPMNISGKTVFLRTHAQDGNASEFLEGLGATVIPGKNLHDKVTDWVNYIKPEFLKRKVGEFKLSDVTDDESTFEGITKMERETLSKYADKNGDLFIKTYFKKSSGIINIANDRMPGMMKLFGYAMETMSPGTKFIASEKMDISKDEHGTKEYRCYVVCGKVNSLSRYVDNNIVNIPDCVYSFSKKFVLAHSDIFGEKASYVVDVCECEDGEIRVVEMNSIEGSGRYESNYADSMVLGFSLS